MDQRAPPTLAGIERKKVRCKVGGTRWSLYTKIYFQVQKSMTRFLFRERAPSQQSPLSNLNKKGIYTKKKILCEVLVTFCQLFILHKSTKEALFNHSLSHCQYLPTYYVFVVTFLNTVLKLMTWVERITVIASSVVITC